MKVQGHDVDIKVIDLHDKQNMKLVNIYFRNSVYIFHLLVFKIVIDDLELTNIFQ